MNSKIQQLKEKLATATQLRAKNSQQEKLPESQSLKNQLQKELENQAKEKLQKKQLKKLEEEKKQKEKKDNNIKEFSSGTIQWKKKEGTPLYHTWEGYFNSKKLFQIQQKNYGYELKLLENNHTHSSFQTIQKKAENIIESFSENFDKFLQESKKVKPKKAEIVILPKNLQTKLALVPESGMGYQIVDLILNDDSIVKNVKILNGSIVKTPAHSNATAADIKDVVAVNKK